MRDQITLIAPQGPCTRLPDYNLKDGEHPENSVTVSSSSVFGGRSERLSNLQEEAEDSLAGASGLLPMEAPDEASPQQGKESTKSLFLGLLPLVKEQYSIRETEETLQLLEAYPLLN